MEQKAARRLIAEHLGITQAMVVDAAHLRDLGADSLDLISLTMRMEEAFEVEISDEEAAGCTTVRDVLDVLGLALRSRGDSELARVAMRARGWA